MILPLRAGRIKVAVPQLAEWGDPWLPGAGTLPKLIFDATL
jgi:hypothetical protein